MAGETPARILIVDDNEMNRDVLSRRLERQGYIVVMAEDGLFAMDALRQAVSAGASFDLLLLDIMMPRMNGYEVLEAMKADAAMRHIPVIVISAMDDLESVVKCIELGADDYLFKPFNPVLLRARINASLSKRAPTLALDQVRGWLDTIAADTTGALSPTQDALLQQARALLNGL
jgi:DNA-binding response OmpR family regulator